LNDYDGISKMMKSKTPEEIEEYVQVFKERIDDFPNGQRILAKINKFETEKNKILEYQAILDELFIEISDVYEDVYSNLQIPYKSMKTKVSTDR
jgi:hypothetical protein